MLLSSPVRLIAVFRPGSQTSEELAGVLASIACTSHSLAADLRIPHRPNTIEDPIHHNVANSGIVISHSHPGNVINVVAETPLWNEAAAGAVVI